MNKVFNLSAIMTVFLSLLVSVSAQSNLSANELFKKYADALGGKDKAEKITTRFSKGTIEMKTVGVSGTFEAYQKAPNKSFMKMNLPGLGDIFEGFNGTDAWSQNPMQGSRLKEGEELDQTKQMSDFYHEFNLATHYPNASVTGQEKVGESNTYVVKADDDTTLYFDVTTGLIVRSDRVMISPQGKITVQIYQLDYKEVDGIKMPFEVRQLMGGMEMILKTTEVKQNVEIEDAKFNKP